jgi:hypothetical protein
METRNIKVHISTAGNAASAAGAASAGEDNRSAETDAAKAPKKATTPIDHSKDVLISNDTTFAELIRLLMKSPAASDSAKFEVREHEMQEKVRKIRESFDEELGKSSGEALEDDFSEESEEMSNDMHDDLDDLDDDPDCGYAQQPVRKAAHRPGAVQLRNSGTRIAMIDLGGGRIEAFTNGYSIYDDGNRKVVLWVPDCSTVTYHFTPLRENEKQYQSQTSRISEDEMGKLPWYFPIMIAGDNRITHSLDHPKSVGSTSDFDFDDDEPSCRWIGCSRFDGPEEAYFKKEAARERRKALTSKQQITYEKYFEEGYSKKEIGRELGIRESAVRSQITRIAKRMRKDPEKYFYVSEN